MNAFSLSAVRHPPGRLRHPLNQANGRSNCYNIMTCVETRSKVNLVSGVGVTMGRMVYSTYTEARRNIQKSGNKLPKKNAESGNEIVIGLLHEFRKFPTRSFVCIVLQGTTRSGSSVNNQWPENFVTTSVYIPVYIHIYLYCVGVCIGRFICLPAGFGELFDRTD